MLVSVTPGQLSCVSLYLLCTNFTVTYLYSNFMIAVGWVKGLCSPCHMWFTFLEVLPLSSMHLRYIVKWRYWVGNWILYNIHINQQQVKQMCF